MVASQSGFDLRFLFAVVRPTAHTRKETQPFADNLRKTNVPQLHEDYKAIYDDHKHGDVIYTLNDSALTLYDQFDEQFCQKLNDKWRNGHMLDRSATEGGKERRLVLRLSVVLLCKIKLDEQEESHDHICDKLISLPGPVCTITNFRASASSKARCTMECTNQGSTLTVVNWTLASRNNTLACTSLKTWAILARRNS
ncbi:hypothetical protein OS493_000601 [Desmophyllum pertusum]|uniref:Uncharacterized protein n=1 Tax=Desmophyllum pertusum TaxID=174260 RepID=A0A9X0DBT4_9CNID|nr:hypothetical protein OS493_000601 [Desmophyllum pertusum]